MSGLSTKDVKTGGGLPKTIQPGEHVLKINNISLKRFPFMDKDDGYYLMLDVETKPVDGFEGFFIDKDDESLGRYEGQIGLIKTNRYYYKDGETKGGTVVKRDMEILKQIKHACIAADIMPWFEKADSKHDTIEEFVEAFNEEKPFKDIFFKFCVAGKEFERGNGYIGYDLFFPKLTRGKIAFTKLGGAEEKVLEYNETEHLQKLAPKEVEDFDDEPENDGEMPTGNAADAVGPPAFEL